MGSVPVQSSSLEEGPATAAARKPVLRQALRLLLHILAIALVPLAVTLTITLLVPEGNDYALATLLKHDRLAAGGTGKIVFVGGSNLAYGLDSAMVERTTGRHVTNMGMNGYFGVRFMLEEVKPFVEAGDIVVVALEYDSYFKSGDGSSPELLMVVKARPESLGYLSPTQRLELLKALPYVAQQKIFRLVREGGRTIYDGVRGETRDDPDADMDRIETRAGFEEHGDLVAHLRVEWKRELGRGYDLTHLPLDPGIIPLLQGFASEMQARGVVVRLSYTPTAASFYAQHKATIDALHARLSAATPLVVPSPPTEFVFPDGWFFDTVYHVDAEGRAARTRRMIEDLPVPKPSP